MDFEWSVVVDALPALFKGAQLTVLITLAGLAGGIVLGIIAGLMRAYGNAALNSIAFAYIELIRGTPIVVQVMFIYFALPTLAEIRVDPITAAITAIVVNASSSRKARDSRRNQRPPRFCGASCRLLSSSSSSSRSTAGKP